MRIIKLLAFFILLGVVIPFISVLEFRLIKNTLNSASSSLRLDDATNNFGHISRRLLASNDNRTTNSCAVLVTIVGVVLFLILICWLLYRRYRNCLEPEVTNVPVQTITAIRQDFTTVVANDYGMYTYTQVVAITDNFRRVLGEGGFGTVYHGFIGKTEVAVKLVSPSSQQGSSEFLAEVNLLATIQHKNLTTLVGYLHEGLNMGIIYEYMANGTLENYLFRTEQEISWERRLRIAIDAAQGLEYLHHQCNPPIVHRDMKTTNILLNDKLQAKLSKFGLSRTSPVGGATHVATAVANSDFGVVLLELITGRPALPKNDRDQQPLVLWVSSQLETGAIANVVDSRLQVGDFSVNSGWKYLELAMACVSHNSNRRPPMTYVAMELQGCLQMHKYLANYENDDSSNSIGVPLSNNTGVPMSATNITSLSQHGT